MMKRTSNLIGFLFCSMILSAQGMGDFKTEFEFMGSTEVKEIRVPVGSGLNQLFFHFSGKIERGSLKVQILDPNGKKEGTFRLESLTRDSSKNNATDVNTEDNTFAYSIVGDSNSSASGSMNKHVSKPIPGQWKVEISVEKLRGKLQAKIEQRKL